MTNRLAQETSPYLLEHANNPVDWYPWGSQALERARTEHKPILLSIGYSACHWCHVMARESFEDPQTAALMNRDFVSIKVDREERPDLDQVYMRAVQGMTGSGGWPMTVFLLPDGTPFFAGTYFPPSDRFGMPAFQRVLAAVADAFARRPADVAETAAQVRDFLHRRSVPLAVGELTPALLDEAAARLALPTDTGNAGGAGGEGGGCVGGNTGNRGGAIRVFPSETTMRSPEGMTRRPGRWHGRRCVRWRRAASTTSWGEASTVTASTSAGWYRTSRRCSTTTPCWCERISMPGS